MSRDIPRKAIRLNVAVQIIAMGVLVLAVNYFSFTQYSRWDFSRSQRFALADQTKRVMKELKKPVRITVVFSPTSQSPESQLYGDVQGLLKELIFSGRKRIEVEHVDPTRDLTKARAAQAKYKFGANENVVILDYEGRTKFLPVAEMGEFDLSPVASGDPPRLLAFRGEQTITNALISLIAPEKAKVYFLQGHREPGIDGASPLSLFRDYLVRQNASVAPLSLSSADVVPSDCAALVIAAPQFDLSEREAELLGKFWAGRGRLMILIDPRVKTPRLDGLIRTAGIVPDDTRVLRIRRIPAVTFILREVNGEFLPGNPITKRLAGASVFFPGETKSLSLDAKRAKDEKIQIWPLIGAAEEFWGERDYVTDEKTGVRYDDGKDVGQPVHIAVAADRGGVGDDRVAVESARLLAVGSCEFAFDATLNEPGLDFLLSAANWLMDRSAFTGVMPKSASHFSLNLTDAQMGTLTLYTLFAIPGAAALMGIIAWVRRRA